MQFLETINNFLLQTKQWQSQAYSWKVDLLFFKRMLEIYGLQAFDEKQKQLVSTTMKKLQYHLDEQLVKFGNELSTHVNYLEGLKEENLLLNDNQLKQQHYLLEDRFIDLGKQFSRFKEEIYQVVEGLKH